MFVFAARNNLIFNRLRVVYAAIRLTNITKNFSPSDLQFSGFLSDSLETEYLSNTSS
ncbi:hypothetical protein C7382_11341 [Porphyromonas loveana]|uniref:Uncharacterized protein n=1 Tax=Porphyromonas loveana TaxID=1884669 RepID=A0A2U1F891_9PORP|nr:hypothetical protein C7382_11341 [Porphyromonas loveana]